MYHSPRDYQSILGLKGELYFENWEVTGSQTAVETRETFMVDLLVYCQELEHATEKWIHVHGQ